MTNVIAATSKSVVVVENPPPPPPPLSTANDNNNSGRVRREKKIPPKFIYHHHNNNINENNKKRKLKEKQNMQKKKTRNVCDELTRMEKGEDEDASNLLGFLLEATDIASPLIQRNKQEKQMTIPQTNTTTKNNNNKEYVLLPNREEDDGKNALLAVEDIAKSDPQSALRNFIAWLDMLVFDLKSRVALLKRSKKRAQKAYMRVSTKIEEENKDDPNGLGIYRLRNSKDLRSLKTLEEAWGVELDETEKSLDRTRNILKAHRLILLECSKDTKSFASTPTKQQQQQTVREEIGKEDVAQQQRRRAALASAVSFYQTALNLITRNKTL